MASFLCVSFFVWYEFDAYRFQPQLNPNIDAQLPIDPKMSEDASGEQPVPVLRLPPGVVGRLEVPSVNLDVVVMRGTDRRTLRRGAGWLPGSAVPGDIGNVAIAAHRDTHFRPLRTVQVGDSILLRTSDDLLRYKVTWTAVVDPNDVQVLDQTSNEALTLITCYPFYYVGTAPKRFVVRAVASDPAPNRFRHPT